MTKTLENVTDNFIPRSQLAKELGERLRGKPFAEMTLIMWEKEGKGPPATRVGREVLYYIPSVEQWLKAQERVSVKKDSAA